MGSRVLLQGHNSSEYIATLAAANRLGLTCCLVDPKLPESSVADYAARTESVITLNLQSTAKVTPFELNDTRASVSEAPHTIDLEANSVVVFTSGSSGTPKGVILTIRNILSNAEASNKNTNLGTGDTWLASLPFHHVGGLGIIYRCALAGATIRIPSYVSISAVSSELGNASHFSMVPTMLREILKSNRTLPSNIKCILLGGEPIMEDLVMEVMSRDLPVLSSYGMSETASHITSTRLTDPKDKIRSVGRPLGNNSVKVINGCVAFKGESLSPGYLDIPLPTEPGGAFLTKDAGYIDEAGYLYITGRTDSVFISGGEKIDPREIEATALSHPGVEVAACISVEDSKWGYRPKLFVEGQIESIDLLLEHLAKKLPRFKVPNEITILEKIPRTALGKIDYSTLRKISQLLLN